MPRVALFFLTCLCVVCFVGSAAAETYRRPGLEGQWSQRHLTAPMNSLRILAGPGQPMLLGQRFDRQIPDAGVQFVRTNPPGAPAEENQWWLRGGVGFGLTEDWEAGALFVPFQLSPSFEFSNVTVFLTRGFRFESWDFGVRLSFQTPSKNEAGKRVWILNPGIPFLYRSGPLRLDAAVLVPFATRDWWVGVNVPLRASVSITPRFFFALESGFVEPRFNRPSDATVPLGMLLGFTELFGARVVDLTAMFSWDSFWLLDPSAGSRALDVGSYRAGLGVVFHSLVR
jgi:hypothetical protein